MTSGNVYQPELGQVLFGQPYQKYVCPDWIETYLSVLSDALYDSMPEQGCPFSNTGAEYKNNVFHAVAYSWSEHEPQPYNFKWRNVEISWYKYLGRGMSINTMLTKHMGLLMLKECLNSLAT